MRQFRRELGIITPRPINGRRPAVIDRVQQAKLVEQKPDCTLAELRELLGVDCALSTLCLAVKGMRLMGRIRLERRGH